MGEGTEMRGKKVPVGGRKWEETFKEAILGQGPFQKLGLLFINLNFFSEYGECKRQDGKYVLVCLFSLFESPPVSLSPRAHFS